VSRLPLRIRLALVFAAAMALVLSGAGWFAYSRVSGDLTPALDQDLRGRAQDLSALVSGGGSVRATQGSLVENGESFAELLRSDGGFIEATRPIERSLLAPDELTAARSGPVFVNRPSVPGLDEPARLLAIPVDGEILVVGATRENRAETLRSLLAAFLIGGPVALVFASLAGYLLAGAALRPIEAMRRRATEISASSLNERLPVPSARDEVSRLGETLNEMLSRLEDGVARERRFVADASHELRTPLTLIKSELGLALKPGRTVAELRQAIDAAAEHADRLARIADDLLLLARAEQGELRLKTEPLDVADVLAEVAGRFRSDGTISVAAGEPMVVSADRLRLEQALTNLLDNAIKYGAGKPVRISVRQHGGEAMLEVRDHGPGIPAAERDLVFLFDRAPKSRDGRSSGLGLAIVRAAVEAHGGTIHFVELGIAGVAMQISPMRLAASSSNVRAGFAKW